MNISFNWLKDLIEIDVTAEETAAALTRVGLAVEGIHPHGDDLVFDIDLTSNRPDCLSHLGVARELSVCFDKQLKATTGLPNEMPLPAVLAGDVVQISDPSLCNRFTARIIRNVKIGPSPKWLVDRLEAIGERSINNVADITNYVMHEIGQPMHSFDLDKLAGGRVIIRTAADSETITTLDEVERKLDPSMLAICDSEKPVAVAGIMGGLDSSITDSTVNVLLEVAYFDRANIRATSRKLNLATEASYRFERGVDIDALVRASNRATEVICELAGGDKGEFIDVFPVKREVSTVPNVELTAAVKRLTGLTVSPQECRRILDGLGIVSDDGVTFTAPSWRHDISIKEDLVEEITRHVGLENIAAELPAAFGSGEYLPDESMIRKVKSVLTDQGFFEAMSYSFIDVANDDRYELALGAGEFVTLTDAVIDGAVRMRPTILPGLLSAVQHNNNFQRRDTKFFEIGKAFLKDAGESMPNEARLLAFSITGSEVNAGRASTGRKYDFYDAKGTVEAIAECIGVAGLEFRDSTAKQFQPGQAADVYVSGVKVGSFGKLNSELSSLYKARKDVYLGELVLDVLLASERSPVTYRPLQRFPNAERDVTFTGNRNVQFADVIKTIHEQNISICRDVRYVDVFEADGLKSLTLRLLYNSEDRTLTDAEVEAAHNEIVAKVCETHTLQVKS